MVTHKHHKVFIGITSIIILIAGLLLGGALAANLQTLGLEVIIVALAFTNIILLLIVGGLVLEIKDMVQAKRGK